MKDAAAYLACIKARLVAHLRVVRWIIGREEAQGEQGLWRYQEVASDVLRCLD